MTTLALDRADHPRRPGAGLDPATLRVAHALRGLFDALGLSRTDPHLADTDLRVAKAYRELLAGLDPGAEPLLKTFPNEEGYTGMVTLTEIPLYSLCAHHFLPFFGTAHLAYLPGERLVGLSKLARAVEFFARRPQVQERLTQQLAGFLEDRLEARGVMVVVEARHLCMEMRGVHRQGVVTTTTAERGGFTDPGLRREFLARISLSTGGSPRRSEHL